MKYRKKPVEIEAIQWTGSNRTEIEQFAYPSQFQFQIPPINMDKDTDNIPDHAFTIKIRTLEGDMIATKGDFIIKGIKGEFYPCKPDIFSDCYEKC